MFTSTIIISQGRQLNANYFLQLIIILWIGCDLILSLTGAHQGCLYRNNKNSIHR